MMGIIYILATVVITVFCIKSIDAVVLDKVGVLRELNYLNATKLLYEYEKSLDEKTKNTILKIIDKYEEELGY